MATMKIILRPSMRGAGHAGSLCLRFIHRREVRQLTTGLRLHTGEWDSRGESILLPEEDAERYPYLRQAAGLLAGYRLTFGHAMSRMESSGSFDLGELAHEFRFRDKLSVLSGFTEQQARLLEKAGNERTARAYRTACRSLTAFNRGMDIPLKQIDRRLIRGFEASLKSRGKAMNTISFYMRMLRAIYRRAVKEKLIREQPDNPFEGVYTGFKQTRKRALDVEELRRLANLDFSRILEGEPCRSNDKKERDKDHTSPPENLRNTAYRQTYPSLYMSWRLFMFCFHARGMSFVDLAYLKKENIRADTLSYYRRKTGRKIEITLSPVLWSIIQSFSAETDGSDYVFPIIRDPEKPERLQYENALRLQNNRLKKLASLAGITGTLTTHVSRHSWATIGKKEHLPLWVISEGLGHATEKITYTYLASFDVSILDKASHRISGAIRRAPAARYC